MFRCLTAFWVMQVYSIRIRQVNAGRIDVAPEEITLGYWMAEGFGRRASGQERNCTKDIGVAEVNRRLGKKPQERTMHRRIGWSANQWRAGQQNVNSLDNNCLDRSRVFACVCRINYDHDEDIKQNKVSESSTKDSLRVREFDGSPKVRRECCRN